MIENAKMYNRTEMVNNNKDAIIPSYLHCDA